VIQPSLDFTYAAPRASLSVRRHSTLILLSAAKEHWDRTRNPHEAMLGGVAHSGRVIFAAGAVMVAVFFTVALPGRCRRRRWA
jgi:hypothetical protein